MKTDYFDVNAKPLGNGTIEHIVDQVTEDDGKEIERERVWSQVLDTLELQTREALISFGWIPPDGERPVVADVRMLVDSIVGKGFDNDKHRKVMVVHGLANKDGWDRESLMLQSPRKLLAIYTRGESV
jgi:hypothetical protein